MALAAFWTKAKTLVLLQFLCLNFRMKTRDLRLILLSVLLDMKLNMYFEHKILIILTFQNIPQHNIQEKEMF